MLLSGGIFLAGEVADGQNGGIPKSCLENQGGMFDRLIVRPTDRPMMMKIRLSTYLPRFRSLSLSLAVSYVCYRSNFTQPCGG